MRSLALALLLVSTTASAGDPLRDSKTIGRGTACMTYLGPDDLMQSELRTLLRLATGEEGGVLAHPDRPQRIYLMQSMGRSFLRESGIDLPTDWDRSS